MLKIIIGTTLVALGGTVMFIGLKVREQKKINNAMNGLMANREKLVIAAHEVTDPELSDKLQKIATLRNPFIEN